MRRALGLVVVSAALAGIARADSLDTTSGTEAWRANDERGSPPQGLDVLEETTDFWEWARAWWRYDQALMRRIREARNEPEAVAPPPMSTEQRRRRIERLRRMLDEIP